MTMFGFEGIKPVYGKRAVCLLFFCIMGIDEEGEAHMMAEQDIREWIENADMVLIGLGEEFDLEYYLKDNTQYTALCEKARAMGKEWLLPAIAEYFAQEACHEKAGTVASYVRSAMTKLAEVVKDKNHFVVACTCNDAVWEAGFRENRMVAPCGGARLKQSKTKSDGEENSVTELTKTEKAHLYNCIERGALEEINLGKDEHGVEYVLNNVYTEVYDENGYLPQWQIYRKWLQGTMNRRVCVLELGVGMTYPSVIRFPFEKVAYFNEKAVFVRVNKNLYFLTEELKEKGVSISQNAVDWLAFLC